MRPLRYATPALVFLVGAAYLALKAAGLLGEGDVISGRAAGRALPVLLVFLLAGGATFAFRRPLANLLSAAQEAAVHRPGSVFLALVAGSLLVHTALFVPFRYSLLRIPDEHDHVYEEKGRGNRLVRVKRIGRYEDYTRNYVMARSVRRLGLSSYFDLADRGDLTHIDRYLCRWALRNHPPGYHVLLAPFTVHPLAARALSLLLYALTTGLAFLLLRHLAGGRAGLLGTLLFWSVPANLFFLGMMTSNDLAVAPFVLAGLTLAAPAVRLRPVRPLASGLLLGLAFLVKYTALLATPWVALVLLRRRGLRRGLLLGLLVLLPLAIIAAGWIAVLAGTPWGPVQAKLYFGRILSGAVDPGNLGAARSHARGSTLDFLRYIPIELGLPLAGLLAVALLSAVRRFREVPAGVWEALALYAICLAAAFLTIPKTNYFFFALPGLCAAPGWYLARGRERSPAAVTLVLILSFGVLRAVLFGLQTS